MAELSAHPAPVGAPMPLTARTDARLARSAAAGDQRAFAAIYERYHQELYRYCRAILGDSHEAQDALQSTMASALRALPGEERAIELRPWLYRVARNESVNLLRRRQLLGEADAAALPQPGADVAYESRERLRSLVSDLARLPERQRSALVMRELSGLSPQEIATALGVSQGAARQLVYEARVGLQSFAEGRAMECEPARRAISDGDGRVMRGRKLRAHLRTCDGCSDFKTAIETRGADLELIAPPLSALAASGVLASLLGGAASVGTGVFGGLFAGVGGGIGAKSLGLIAASAAIGVGAGAIGEVDVPGLGAGSDSGPASESQADPSGAEPASASDSGTVRSSAGAGADAGERRDEHADGRGPGAPGNGKAIGRDDQAGAGSQPASGSAAGGASAAAPAGDGRPETPPGSGLAGDRSGGHSATPTTGVPERAAFQGLPEHSNAGGVLEEREIPRNVRSQGSSS